MYPKCTPLQERVNANYESSLQKFRDNLPKDVSTQEASVAVLTPCMKSQSLQKSLSSCFHSSNRSSGSSSGRGENGEGVVPKDILVKDALIWLAMLVWHTSPIRWLVHELGERGPDRKSCRGCRRDCVSSCRLPCLGCSKGC